MTSRGAKETAGMLVWTAVALLLSGTSLAQREGTEVRYVGSSTIAKFVLDAQDSLGGIYFILDTAPESYGGMQAVLSSQADLGGVAGELPASIKEQNLVATLIGKDAIAVIVNQSNSVKNLSLEQLKGIFTGMIRNWQAVGGPDLAVQPFIVGPDSATRNVFRAAVLGDEDYRGCEVVTPDSGIIERVLRAPGAIGQISFAFVSERLQVRPISVDGQEPSFRNFDYPITRPLYLVTRGEPLGAVKKFMDWTLGEEGQRIVMRRFVGRIQKVLGSVGPAQPGAAQEAAPGYLIVYTSTYPVEDSDIYYYPHRPYDIYDLSGKLVRHVCNHRSEFDEQPATVRLAPGKYHVVTLTATGRRWEVQVTIEENRITRVDVEALLRDQQRRKQ